MATLGIKWQTVERVSSDRDGAVVTGDTAKDSDSEGAQTALKWSDKPIIVYVCDEAAGCEGFDKLEEVVLKDEKVALGMKAFRTIKMHPDDVAEDAVLSEAKGKEVPRMLIIEPIKMKITVLEKNKLKTSGLYGAMKKVAGKFWKEKLDKVVKSHLKILTEQDQLVNADKVLADKIGRLSGEDGKSAEKELEKVKKERDEVQTQMKELDEKESALWKLTPKKKKAA